MVSLSNHEPGLLAVFRVRTSGVRVISHGR
jgi:hypothetical protein